MKNVKVTNLTKDEKEYLRIIKTHYGIKTDSGALRHALFVAGNACAIMVTADEKKK